MQIKKHLGDGTTRIYNSRQEQFEEELIGDCISGLPKAILIFVSIVCIILASSLWVTLFGVAIILAQFIYSTNKNYEGLGFGSAIGPAFSFANNVILGYFALPAITIVIGYYWIGDGTWAVSFGDLPVIWESHRYLLIFWIITVLVTSFVGAGVLCDAYYRFIKLQSDNIDWLSLKNPLFVLSSIFLIFIHAFAFFYHGINQVFGEEINTVMQVLLDYLVIVPRFIWGEICYIVN